MPNSTGSSANDRFDQQRADRACSFFEQLLRHPKGRKAREPFILADWQRDQIIRPLFGSVRYDHEADTWVRQYRIAWIETSRKCGKSSILAGIALLLLCADDEEGAEVFGAAKDRDQASLVFDVARRMVELSPVLSRRLRIFPSNKRIVDPKTSSFYRVIAADASGNLGQNPHGIIFDEVIAQPNRELWDALRTGMGARTQPLMVAATTAGNDQSSFAWQEHEYCQRVAEKPDLDPARFVFMRNTPADADWRDEQNWTYANPALGDFLSIEALREEAREAEANPAAQNRFRQFRLNQWVQQHTRWIDLGVWDANAGILKPEDLRGRECYGGLDLSSTTDITAFELIFPDAAHDDDGPIHVVLSWFWMPEDTISEREARDAVPYTQWAKDGFVRGTDGNAVDYSVLRDDIAALAKQFKIRDVGYDPWNATHLTQELEATGLAMVPIRQGAASLSPPSKELERLLVSTRLRHGGNPVLRFMADCVEVKTDPAGNIRPVKPDRRQTSKRVDGIVALIMAIDRMTRRQPRKNRTLVSF